MDEVIDILDQIGQDDFTAQAMSRPQPQRPAPVNVGMMPERRGDVTIPMQQSAYVPFDNIIQRDRTMGQTTDLNYQMDPKDNLGFVQSPYATLNPNAANFSDFMSGDVNPISTAPYTGIEQILARQAQAQGQGQGLGAINPYEQFGDPLLGGDASTILGVNAFDKRAAELLGYDMETMEGVTKYLNDTKRSMENQERDQRLDDERRERAAMLAAQQQQPVDPCPEGYRLDPVSKVCVPVDDTTEPDNIAPRTYDTMTRPEPNYTAATGATLPVITLPDILG